MEKPENLAPSEFPKDPIDIASHNELLMLDINIKHIQDAANRKDTHPDFDGETCVSCGDDIPPERLDAGRVRCTHCQEVIEKRKKLHS